MSIRNICKRRNPYSSFNRYKWYMKKSQDVITKELDLRKFLTRQRVFTTAILGLLSGKQSFLVDKMSQMIIREDDTQTSGTSSEGELSDWQRDNMNYADKMATSKDPIDRRFINLYIYRKAT